MDEKSGANRGGSNFKYNHSGFQEFIDLIPEIVYELDINGNLTMVNKAGLDILGYTTQEFEKGIHIHEIIIPQEIDYLRNNIKKLKDLKKSFKVEYHARKKDGTVIPVLVNSTPIFKDGVFIGTRGIVIDLTESKLNERKLKDANDFLNTTINIMQEPFFVKDENHKWVILNDASIKMWGHTREELIGKSDYDVFPKEQADIFWEKDDFVFRNGSNTNIEEITNSNGEVRTIVTAKVLFVDEITKKKFIVGTIHDITDVRKAEFKLKEYSEELEELNKNKDKFFSIIAHDLRNPFTSIHGFASVLNDEFDTLSKEEIREYINYVFIGTKNIYRLIENLLTWTRLQSGRINVQPVKINIYSKVQDAINVLIVLSQNRKVKLLNIVDKNIYVLADDNMVDSILQNIISNAIKFSKAQGTVKIESHLTGNLVEISVTDNGIGMSKTEIDDLFHLGKQKGKYSGEDSGTGLGLIICKEMISRLNGQLKVKSIINVGSTFSITLPKAK